MNAPFQHYVEVMNNYCLVYEGDNETFAHKLLSVRKHLENVYPLHVFVALKDKFVTTETGVISIAFLMENLDDFAIVYYLEGVATKDPTDVWLKLEKKPQKQN